MDKLIEIFEKYDVNKDFLDGFMNSDVIKIKDFEDAVYWATEINQSTEFAAFWEDDLWIIEK